MLLWEATDKGWTLKAGVCASIFLIILHLIGFFYVFRPDNPDLHSLQPLDPVNPRTSHRRETVFGVEVPRRPRQPVIP